MRQEDLEIRILKCHAKLLDVPVSTAYHIQTNYYLAALRTDDPVVKRDLFLEAYDLLVDHSTCEETLVGFHRNVQEFYDTLLDILF